MSLLLLFAGAGAGGAEPPVVAEVLRGGTSKRDKKRKRPQTYAEALLNEVQALPVLPIVEPEEDEDEILLIALTKILH